MVFQVRGTLGPIVTTGVAMVAAVVVVVNPVMPHRADVQIPAIALSAGADDALGMLDDDFLKAIAPEPAESTNPFVVIKDLISSLASDGKNAIVDAFVAGATAASKPELTATGVPEAAFNPAPAPPAEVLAESPAYIPVLPPVLVPETGMTAVSTLESYLPVELANVATGALPDLTPVMADALNSVVDDVSYVGKQLVTAAFAAGAVLAAEPGLIVDTLRQLLAGNVRGALQSAVTALTIPFGIPKIVIETIQTIVTQHLADIPEFLLPFIPQLPAVQVPAPGAGVPAGTPDVPVPDTTEQLVNDHRQAVAVTPVIVPSPAASRLADSLPQAEPATTGGTDLSDGNKVAPGHRTARSGSIGAAVTAAADQAQSALRDAGDSVRKATSRVAKAAAGS
ncbi:MAG: hypothetical protein ACR2JM_07725 [Mycobacterium sp.]